jgi:hypothetical protein
VRSACADRERFGNDVWRRRRGGSRVAESADWQRLRLSRTSQARVSTVLRVRSVRRSTIAPRFVGDYRSAEPVPTGYPLCVHDVLVGAIVAVLIVECNSSAVHCSRRHQHSMT